MSKPSGRPNGRPKTAAADYQRIMTYLPPELVETLRQDARVGQRAFNTQVIITLRQGVAAREGMEQPDDARGILHSA